MFHIWRFRIRRTATLTYLWCAALLLATTLFHVIPVAAQTGSASLAGTVTDTSKAVIRGATVKITDVSTGTVRTIKSDSIGHFAFAALKPSTYAVHVSSEKFKNFEVDGVVLNTGDQKELTAVLEPGGVSETVTVSAASEAILTTESSVSNVIGREYIENQPLNGRSFEDLYTLSPGTTTESPQALSTFKNNAAFHGGTTVNGQSSSSNGFTLDGVNAATGAGNWNGSSGAYSSGTLSAQSALGTTQNLVSVDALQEFRVETSTFAPEYGPGPGAQYQFTTRSGSNSIHGTAFDNIRNGFFDANDAWNDLNELKQPLLHQNDFGGTLGGPIRIPHLYNGKDRTFFFVNYEGLRLTDPQEVAYNAVPDALLRASISPNAGGLGALLLGFPTLPASYSECTDNTVAGSKGNCNQAIKKDASGKVIDNGDTGYAMWNKAYAGKNRIDSTSVRIDHLINNNHTIFFRWAESPSQTNGVSLVTTDNQIAQNTITWTAGLTSTFSSRLTNELRVNYTLNNGHSGTSYVAEAGSVPTDVLKDFGYADGEPAYYIGWWGAAGGGGMWQGFGKSVNSARQFNVTEALSYMVGKHTFKVGGSYRRFANVDDPMAPFQWGYSGQDWNGETQVDGFNNFANGVMFEIQSTGTIQQFPVFTTWAAYLQDEYKPMRKLTVSYGVRWDVDPPASSNRGTLGYTLLNIYDPKNVKLDLSGKMFDTDWHSFAPRLGFSYLANEAHGRETIIRGGFGLFYDLVTGQANTTFGEYNPGTSTTAERCIDAGDCWTKNYTMVPGNTLGGPDSFLHPPVPVVNPQGPFSQTLSGIPHNLTNPYTLEYNFAVQQSLPGNNVLSLTYVGSRNYKMVSSRSVYVGNIPNVQSAQLSTQQNQLHANYNSLQAVIQHRIGHGLYGYGSYTWSHNIGQQMLNSYMAPINANTAYDLRHNFNGVITYNIPGNYSSRFASALLKGWGTDVRETFRTGFPYTPYAAGQTAPTGCALVGCDNNSAIGGGRTPTPANFSPAYLAGGVPLYISTSQIQVPSGFARAPGGRALNPAAFVQTDYATPGDGTTPSGVVFNTAGMVPINSFRGFNAIQTNLAIRRDFPITEQLKLQFRAEAFNLFNHPMWGAIDAKIEDANFGDATGTLAAGTTVGQASQYATGGARTMQFMLKLMF